MIHVLGLDDPSGRWYLAWSGFIPNLVYLSVVGGMVTLVRRHQCHAKWCWRIGKHVHEGTPWCFRHHPTGVTTREDVTRADDAS